MAVYKTSEKSRNKIVKACSELFYKKGYVGTTYNDICEKAESNPGLINYYFKTKRKLAQLIYGNIFVDIKGGVERYLLDNYGVYELQVATTLEQLIFSYLVDSDEGIRRFYYEICKEGIEFDIKIFRYFYKLHLDRYHLNISEEKLKLIQIANSSISMGVSRKYLEGYINLSRKEIFEFQTKNMYQSMGVSDARIDEIMKEAYEIFDKIHIEVKDYFVVTIT
ncbi:MAG: TetR/AcrR family transcriptional regulator [Eubacteriaceae bacterium]|nr:TetR/AcrR family transcriptional regulator [Eubacteriaceae bacterium]